jgi:hypothetical protein
LLQGGRAGGHSAGIPSSLDTARTSEMDVDLKALIKDVSEIKAKVSGMPTTLQMQAWFVGVSMGLVAVVFAIIWTVK